MAVRSFLKLLLRFSTKFGFCVKAVPFQHKAGNCLISKLMMGVKIQDHKVTMADFSMSEVRSEVQIAKPRNENGVLHQERSKFK